jgi:hypothetical protein
MRVPVNDITQCSVAYRSSCVIPVRDITQCSVVYRGSHVFPVRDIMQCSVAFYNTVTTVTVQPIYTCDITMNYHSTFWGLIVCGVSGKCKV